MSKSFATYATAIGPISSGTLLTEALLEAFADELVRIGLGDVPAVLEARAALVLIDAGWPNIVYDDRTMDLITALADLLNEQAPPYCYFGAHPGDDSDFGFWPDLAAIEALPKVSDPSGVPTIGDDCIYVNDQGRIKVYASDGTTLLELT
jgi:hypothetical protein